jgi:glycine oxidase
MKGADWVVIGGGVIGLAAAWQFARGGAKVEVLEARRLGAGASAKAAGMLPPAVEGLRHPELLPWLTESFELYPAFVRALEADAGLDVAFRRSGCLLVAPGESFGEVWPGVPLVSPEELAQRQPGLAPDMAAGYVAEAAHVDPPLLLRALASAARRHGVAVREGALVSEIRHVADRWLAVRTPFGWVEGDRFLVATGAWSSSLLAPLGVDLGVYPVKGQMVELLGPGERLGPIVFGPGVYLCPKDGGRLLVGSTMEEVGFSERVTAGAVASLLAKAVRILPELADFTCARAWAGLRPGRAGLPYVDGVAQNAFAAVGHFRNGILLAPVTVERLLRMAAP